MISFRQYSVYRGTMILWLSAFMVRLVAVLLGQLGNSQFLVAADAKSVYLPIARSLASGQGFQINGDFQAASAIAPVYPLYLSLLMRFIGSEPPIWIIGVLNAGLRAAGCIFIYWLARRYFGERAAKWAFVLYVIDPWEMFWTGYVLKESLAVPFFLLAIWMLSRLSDQLTPTAALLTGAAIGAATLARYPSFTLWFVSLWVLCRAVHKEETTRHKGLPSAGLLGCYLTLAMVIVLMPWAVRRWSVGSHTGGMPIGTYLYLSNGPGKVFSPTGYAEGSRADRRPLATRSGETPLEVQKNLILLTVQHFLSHPQIVVKNLTAKMITMWRPTFSAASSRNFLLLGLPYCFLMGISLLGMMQAMRQNLPCLVIVLPVVLMVCLHLILWAEIRNRQYLLPLFYIFGGLAIDSLIRTRPSNLKHDKPDRVFN